MAYQVLARKWRPKKFDQVIGQEHITRSLKNALKTQKIGHAFLLSGTRGIGKTSVARLFAKALRCKNIQPDFNPCGECDSCTQIDAGNSIDVMEIDGASNNGVENIRQLIENVQYLPTEGKVKVYIIDEVHMLSTSAFNALLKTLEEPPEHVIFIFATTDPQKLLGTVLSRCQRFDFRNITVENLQKHLQNICDFESIKYSSPQLLKQIAIQAKGSARDALSLLDQVLSFSIDKEITEDTLVVSLGLAKVSAVKEITNSLLMGDKKKLINNYRSMVNENVVLENILKSLLDNIYHVIENLDDKQALLDLELIDPSYLENISTAEIFWIYETLAKDTSWCLTSIHPEKLVEILLLKICLRKEILGSRSRKVLNDEDRPAPAPREERPETVSQEVYQEPVQENKEPEIAEKKEQTLFEQWEQFLQTLFETNPALGSNLEQGNIYEESYKSKENINIVVGYKDSTRVFYEHLNNSPNKIKLKEKISEYFSYPLDNVTVEFKLIETKNENFESIVEKNDRKKEEKIKQKEDDFLNNPVLKEAQKMFSAKVDKVIISDEN